MVRTTYPLALILCFGLVMGMFAGSGFNGIVDGDRGTGQASDALAEQGNQSKINDSESIDASRASSDDGSIAGVILSSGRSVLSIVGMIALLPVTLQNLGFPGWFVAPVGSLFYVVSGIGIIQFISGRFLE